jgi:hypothetical protein
MFEFQDQDKIDSLNGKIHTLAGFAVDKYGVPKNFILSNGERSKIGENSEQDLITDYYHMIPADALHKIRSVTIYYFGSICGFSFFDKDGALLWKIGFTLLEYDKETVMLEENEAIVGVNASR